MEFVDYKCLESLLIEGEDIIATEGIGKILGSLIKGVFSLIGRVFRTIAGIFRNLIGKLKNKKPVKDSSNSNTDKTPDKYDEYRIEQEGDYLSKKFDKEEKDDKSTSQNSNPQAKKIHIQLIENVFSAGDEVTRVLNILMDSCSAISVSISENNEYKESVSNIQKYTPMLEEKYNAFENRLNKFKELFNSVGKRISVDDRKTCIEKCSRLYPQYINYANRCENKLKHLNEIEDEFDQSYIEKKGIDIQKHRSPAQMVLNKMSSYASKMSKLYIEFNNVLSNAVIVFD